VSGGYSTLNEQFVSYVMAKASCIRSDNCEVHLVLNQYA